jgi:hypothetical protein
VAAAAATALLAVVALPAHASQTTTTCVFGGPTGTSQVRVLDLPDGSDFVTVRITAARPTRATSTHYNWHLAQGVFVIDDTTGTLIADHVRNEGTSPRRVVAGGTSLEALGPDTPFVHEASLSTDHLAPGRYLLVGFGSDGSPALPNDQWGVEVVVGGTQTCPLGATISPPASITSPLDVDHTDFAGGSKVGAAGVTSVDGATYGRTFGNRFVSGFVDASVQGAGDARVDYSHAGVTGSIVDDIQPFVALGGAYSWTATLHGVALANVVGVGVDG